MMNIFLGVMVTSSLLQLDVVQASGITKSAINERRLTAKLLNVQLWPDQSDGEDLKLLGQILEDIEGGRGKSQKYKKLSKTLYPLFMGVLIAKIVLIPLILKMLTAISTAALVMSKIALITTGLLALKWIFSGSSASDGNKDYTHFELVYVPPKYEHSRPYRGIQIADDQSWSGTNLTPATANTKQAYIPLKTTMHNGARYPNYGDGGSIAAAKLSPNAAAPSDLYRYNQQNNNNYYSSYKLNEGKPFL